MKTKTNEELQKDVQDAIKWEPLLNAAEIGVTAKDGIISLTGVVDNYYKKLEAENAAKNVMGVKAVVEKIEIKFSGASNKTNSQVAIDVLDALKMRWDVPNDKVKVGVEDGWVTLGGELSWYFQKNAAQDAVAYLNGVKGVTNNIKIKSEINNQIKKEDIEHAIDRHWSLSDSNIQVAVSGNTATLTGTVASWYQRNEAERIAWDAPGVWNIENKLIIG